ncbi:SDR family oxidoreductase [Bacillus sp. SCS-153A]|uniref:SDR family oxidoreductase n=1 Tax=Rossellomorea sedimentorum TaxID=3115294 RepID=UPI0039068962
MNLGLKDKRVVVTASSKGLGFAAALEFAKEGSKVLLSSRNEEELQQAVSTIRQITGNGNIHYRVCNMINGNDIKALFQTAEEWMGGVDILINNTGGPPAGGFDSFSDEDWEYSFKLNLLSYIRTIREALPYMRKNKKGRILNIASSSTKQAIDGLILSNTFRSGVVGLAKSLSSELAPDNILINTVGPGRIATDRVAELDQINASKLGIPAEEFRTKSETSIPLGRYGEPEEFAKVLVFLASDANTYLTGQSLLVDGGMVKAL